MEMKWLAILVIGVFSGLFTAIAVDKYSENQCKIAYAASNKTAEDIVKLCGRQHES